MNLSKKANFSASAGAEKRPRFPRLKSRGPIEARRGISKFFTLNPTNVAVRCSLRRSANSPRIASSSPMMTFW